MPVHVAPRAGLNGKDFPFWRGERAETIVAARIAAYPKRGQRRAASTDDDPIRAARKRLNRLRRSLKRRKGAETIQRIKQEIHQLEMQLA